MPRKVARTRNAWTQVNMNYMANKPPFNGEKIITATLKDEGVEECKPTSDADLKINSKSTTTEDDVTNVPNVSMASSEPTFARSKSVDSGSSGSSSNIGVFSTTSSAVLYPGTSVDSKNGIINPHGDRDCLMMPLQRYQDIVRACFRCSQCQGECDAWHERNYFDTSFAVVCRECGHVLHSDSAGVMPPTPKNPDLLTEVNVMIVRRNKERQTSMEDLCTLSGVLGMPAFNAQSYDKYEKYVFWEMCEKFSRHLGVTYAKIVDYYENLGLVCLTTGSADISVRFDFVIVSPTSRSSMQLGIGVLTDVRTGLVIDVEVLMPFNEKEGEFDPWFRDKVNPEELESLLYRFEEATFKTLWDRPHEKFKYTNFLGKMHSVADRTLRAKCREQNTRVRREEHIPQACAHFEMRLRMLNLSVKDGRVTYKRGPDLDTELPYSLFNRLKEIYRQSLFRMRNGTSGSLQDVAMQCFYHYVGSDKHPKHKQCPKGEQSDCLFQEMRRRGDESGATFRDKRRSCHLSEEDYKKVEKLFLDLTQQRILEMTVVDPLECKAETLMQKISSRCSKEHLRTLDDVRLEIMKIIMEYNIDDDDDDDKDETVTIKPSQ